MDFTYSYFEVDSYIIIYDESCDDKPPMQDIEFALERISEEAGLQGKIILYRMPDGEYRGIVLDSSGYFVGYQVPASDRVLCDLAKILLNNVYTNTIQTH